MQKIEMCLLFLNFISISILVYGVYYRLNRESGYFFVLYIFNALVFFVASVLAIVQFYSADTGSISLAELVFANGVILLFCSFSIKVWANVYLSTQNISYDKINLIVPDKRDQLIEDIHKRTGLDAVNVKIDKINLQKNTASISVL